FWNLPNLDDHITLSHCAYLWKLRTHGCARKSAPRLAFYRLRRLESNTSRHRELRRSSGPCPRSNQLFFLLHLSIQSIGRGSDPRNAKCLRFFCAVPRYGHARRSAVPALHSFLLFVFIPLPLLTTCAALARRCCHFAQSPCSCSLIAAFCDGPQHIRLHGSFFWGYASRPYLYSERYRKCNRRALLREFFVFQRVVLILGGDAEWSLLPCYLAP